MNWQYQTLPHRTRKALDFLSQQQWLTTSGWYLAGGTALALQAGHRRSLDLDFFTLDSDFDTKKLLSNFARYKNWETTVEEKNTIYGELSKSKISFIAYPFFLPKQNFLRYGSIRILNQLDIAVMKITAISQRGKKRDYFDLYWCANNVESLEDIIKRLKIQYPSVAHNYHHILKSLVFFEDAETDPNPEIYFDATWAQVKKYFLREVPIIANRIIR
ncbi:MAG: nucleotidyl transferase AbiEii/AbiGii toxin family protein [Patescibacteria group bacterium]